MKVALFDLDGVIIFRKESFGDALHRIYHVPLDKINQFFTEWGTLFLSGRADVRQKLAPQLSIWRVPMDIDEALQLWYEIENTQPDERMLLYIDTLRANGIHCFIASNQMKERGEELWKMIGSHFDGHFFSYEVRYIKAEPEYWQSVLRDLSVEPSEVLYWDDEMANIEEATKHGVNAKLFTTYEDFIKNEPYQPSSA